MKLSHDRFHGSFNEDLSAGENKTLLLLLVNTNLKQQNLRLLNLQLKLSQEEPTTTQKMKLCDCSEYQTRHTQFPMPVNEEMQGV